MNYEVVKLNGGAQFDLVGVRFLEKNFMFWKKKNVNRIEQIIVIFDKKYEGMQVKDGVMVLSLKGLTNYEDLRNAISIFLIVARINQINVQIQFVVENESQKQIADALGNEFGFSYVVNNVNQRQEQNIKAMEERLKNNNVSSIGNQMIEKYDNGQLKKITINDGNAYENNGFLDSEEEKASLLRTWMNNPAMASKLMNMSDQERNDLLSREVLSNRKQYKLEEANQRIANDKVGEVAKNVAKKNGGLVNTDIGVIQHDGSMENQYYTVEKNGDNVQVVNPSVTEAKISSGGVVGNSTSGNVVDDFQTDRDIQQRDVTEQVFYVDEERNIFNNDFEEIGKLGVDGYQINYEDNSLSRYGQIIGYMGDYKDIGKSTSKKSVNVKKRILEKNDEEKSGGFISVAVIMFVLSALLLIGSVILLFVLE